MAKRQPAILTWRNLGRHLLAFSIASLSVGFFSIAAPTMIEIIQFPSTFGKHGLFPFVLTMGLFIGLFYAKFSSLFVLSGIAAGVWLDRSEWWFSASWGALSTLATARLFHDPAQNLGAPFYLTVLVAGFLAGIIYWRIAVRPSVKRDQGPTISSH